MFLSSTQNAKLKTYLYADNRHQGIMGRAPISLFLIHYFHFIMKNLFFWAVLTAALCVTNQSSAQNADEAAIKALIEKETTSYHNANVAGMIECWANVPQTLLLVSAVDAEGKPQLYMSTNEKSDLPQQLTQMMKDAKPDGITFQNTDYVFRINGNSAFVRYEQTETDPKGTKIYAHETRYLEKIGGQWKIVYVGAAFYTK